MNTDEQAVTWRAILLLQGSAIAFTLGVVWILIFNFYNMAQSRDEIREARLLEQIGREQDVRVEADSTLQAQIDVLVSWANAISRDTETPPPPMPD